MNVLILGGQGFIGHNLVLRLLEKGYNVTIFTRNIRKNINISDCKYINGEFQEIRSFKNILDNIDIVYHLISTTIPGKSNDNPVYDIESNVISTVKFLEMCGNSNVKKIIFSSSGGTVYGYPRFIPIPEEHGTNPICSYGISKLMIEKYLYMFNDLYGLNYQVVRISNPYGPYHNALQQGVIDVFLSNILKSKTIEIWGDGSICRDFIYIDDVVDVFCTMAVKDVDAKILNIGSGKGTTLNDLIHIMKNVTGADVDVEYRKGRKVDIPVNILDVSKAYEQLGWKPKTGLDTGIKMTWDRLKNEV